MAILSGDPLTQLSFSIYENKGLYVLLLGSGISRAASIPTGWEITIDLIRRVALAQKVEDQSDWAKWYITEFGKEPNYSEIVGELGLSRDERRSILHSYIEPDERDRIEKLKTPTKAHKAIARLVREGYVKVIVTTNFDRLLENALREEGVEPTVVASVDALSGAEPLAHTSCFLLKLHGDYKDARILNTEDELETYPSEYNALLDRIIDEYGLIICGWSGEWDHALRSALLRAPARRYPLYWAARSKLKGAATDIVLHRDARVIENQDGESFFEGLEQRISTLARTHHQNPLSIELLENTTKRYLAKSEHRIQLDDLFTSEMKSLIQKLDAEELCVRGQWSLEEFRQRTALYESHSEPLARMSGILGRWGDGKEKTLVIDLIETLSHYADQEQSGLSVWLQTRSYPAVLIMTAYGLGLVRSQRWNELHDLLVAPIQKPNGQGNERTIEKLFLTSWHGGNNEYWQSLDGLDRRKTALSDHLCDLFQEWSKSFVGVSTDVTRLYESWEILGGLVYLEGHNLQEFDIVSSADRQSNFVWFPIGRSAWHGDVRDPILEPYFSVPVKSALLESGFAKGDEMLLEKLIQNYRHFANYYRW